MPFFIAGMLFIDLFLCDLSVISHSRMKKTLRGRVNLASENSLPIRQKLLSAICLIVSTLPVHGKLFRGLNFGRGFNLKVV